ncbi:hypothetical protein [Mangrovivirga cuniculi]|uniref:Uncharacterized protein n=1 Tax=Mangrovivirga cuniculi TaxID=2715131 RepID=A0A4D7K916_9BACT|nr:hypothetical protein [Mangrovivirga cuniculi]QCK15788.1 hypothetical protein DCC35_14050 [Mangrovivirga cuniculi]
MNAEHTNLKDRVKKNTRNLAIWTFAWVITVALVSFGAKFLWDFNETISIAAIILNLITGIGLILANRRYIMELDELQRKIFMDAMAMALGVAVVGGLAYSMMDITNIIKGDAEISIVVMMIGITYMVSIIIGNFRYK